MITDLAIIRPRSDAEIGAAKALCERYIAWLGEDICFQGVDAELAGFPALYSPPAGALRLAMYKGAPVGVVGLKGLAPGICEMKRMYVEPDAWGLGVGRALAQAIIADARGLGYAVMRLDTLPRLESAVALYRRLGFQEIPAYNDNPIGGVLFFELRL